MSLYLTHDVNTFGRRDYQKGPVTSYEVGNISHQASRGYNRFEKNPGLGKIQDALETQLEAAHEKASKKYLRLMRRYLKGLNLKNHVVTIRSAMGASALYVTNVRTEQSRAVNDLSCRSEAVARLQELHQFIEGSWEWAWYLDGQELTLSS